MPGWPRTLALVALGVVATLLVVAGTGRPRDAVAAPATSCAPVAATFTGRLVALDEAGVDRMASFEVHEGQRFDRSRGTAVVELAGEVVQVGYERRDADRLDVGEVYEVDTYDDPGPRVAGDLGWSFVARPDECGRGGTLHGDGTPLAGGADPWPWVLVVGILGVVGTWWWRRSRRGRSPTGPPLR
jgi:hypothetical protein